MSKWHYVKMALRQNDIYVKMTFMSKWHLCQNDNYVKMTFMSKWHYVKMTLCQNGIMSKWHYVKMALCQNGIMTKWHNDILSDASKTYAFNTTDIRTKWMSLKQMFFEEIPTKAMSYKSNNRKCQ
jgi:hypothetical protein